MRAVTIIIATADPARFRAALTLALATSALGKRARVYCHEQAVTLLAREAQAADDGAGLAAAGLPDRRALLAMAQEAGVALIACQTGLAMAGLTLGDLCAGAQAGGMIGLLADGPEDQLVSF